MSTILKDRVCKEVLKDFNELVEEEGYSCEEAVSFIVEEYLSEVDEFTEEELTAESALVYTAIYSELQNRNVSIDQVTNKLKTIIEAGADLPFWKEDKTEFENRKNEWNKLYEQL